MYTIWENLDFNDFAIMFNPLKPGGDDRDQMISFIMDWFLPKVMFNVYLEWARNDYSPDLRWALSYPQHSQGYTLGFQKLVSMKKNKIISIVAEVTELVCTKDADGVCPSYYRHGIVIQGYTHLGQVMGAAIGPGSNSQFLQASYYTEWGYIGPRIQRIAYDQDYYFANPVFTVPDNENVEWIVGVDGVVFLNELDLGFKLSISDNWNRNYDKDNDVWNLYGMLSFKYNF